MRVRNWSTFASIGLAIGFLVITDSLAEARKASGGSEKSSIYFKSQKAADTALAQFEKDNATCQLWTDWQKICSRTGPEGATMCMIDPNIRVRPSRPFCVVGAHPFGAALGMASFDTSSMRTSRNRFCFKIGNGLLDESEDSSLLPNCESYNRKRPFNGLSLPSVRHPMCEVWSEKGGSEDALLRCVKFRPQQFCPQLIGVTRPLALSDDGLMIGHLSDGKHSPVWGTYCAPNRSDQ